jgi:hypothetical protein
MRRRRKIKTIVKNVKFEHCEKSHTLRQNVGKNMFGSLIVIITTLSDCSFRLLQNSKELFLFKVHKWYFSGEKIL